jgi:membrane-anchored glycerophosphoryl diester phosphodiesterase (GDPDase)
MRNAKEVPRAKKMKVDQILSFSFSALIKEKAAYGQWMLMGLIIAIINLLPVGVFALGMDFNSNFSILVEPERYFENINVTTIVAASILLLIAGLIDLVFAFFSASWFLRLGLDAYDSVTRSFKERFNMAFKDLGRLIGPMILVGIFNFVVLLPYTITNTISGINPDPSMVSLSMGLYFIGLFVIYFVVIKISCLYGILLDRELGFVEAVKTSIQMTKGRWWRIFGYYFLVGLLSIVMGLVFCIIPIILWVVTVVSGFAAAMVGVSVLLTVVAYVLMICASEGVSSNMQMAIYRCLEIEHSEDETLQTPDATFNAIENSDENDLKF